MYAARSKATFEYSTLTPEPPRALKNRVVCKKGHIQTPMVQVWVKEHGRRHVRCGVCREEDRQLYNKKNRLRQYA